MEPLHLGKIKNGKHDTPFEIPADAVTETFALMAIRGAGKTNAGKIMAEAMSKAGLPWICFDPIGVWWGLRANKDGTPNKYCNCLVIGGERGDIPLTRNGGAHIAEALIESNMCAVIDLSQESKTFWRIFVTDFCMQMMRMNPAIPHHLFIEEAPEFVPQKASVDLTRRCAEAVDRIVRLGRNRGYGCTLISQRPATVNKDVLSQCTNLFMLRTIGAQDRKALENWAENRGGKEFNFSDLASLHDGEAYFWSPEWMKCFQRIQFDESKTHHPGRTRSMGDIVPKSVTLAVMEAFAEKLRGEITKKEAKAKEKTAPTSRDDQESVPGPRGGQAAAPAAEKVAAATAEAEKTIADLRTQLIESNARALNAERRLSTVKTALGPLYTGLSAAFSELQDEAGTSAGDKTLYAPWLAKAGRAGTKRLLEIMIERGECTKAQLGTLGGISYKHGTFRNYLSWMRRNGLIVTEGDIVRLRPLT